MPKDPKAKRSYTTGKLKEKPRGRGFAKGNNFGKKNAGKKRKSPGPGYLKRCKDFMEAEGWDFIFEMARQDDDRKLKLDASKFVAYYAHGKPKETLDVTSKGRSFADAARHVTGR